MKLIRRDSLSISWRIFYTLFLVMAIAGCSSGGGSGGSVVPGISGSGDSTTISGKVSLSGSVGGGVSLKPGFYKLDAMDSAPKGKPGSKSYLASLEAISPLHKVLYETNISSKPASMGDGTVYLYNASHPEWLCPVAEATTEDGTGSYTLTTLINANCNENAYNDGDEIPADNYTLLAYKPAGYDAINAITTGELIAIQSVIKRYVGAVTGADLVAQESDAVPVVKTMFGVSKNRDGTNTWGGSNASGIDTNMAIQVTFNMAISRSTLENAIKIDPAVPGGHWALSADWLSATYYYGDEKLTPDTTYAVTVYGEDLSDTPIRNVYGNPLPETAIGTFITAAATTTDDFPPTVRMKDPINPIDVDVTEPIRVESNKPLDINGLLLESEPSLGTQPGVIYVGKNEDAGSQFKYVYEFLLGEPLQVDTAYNITVSGGKDLAGRLMNPEYHSFRTKSAALQPGIDDTAASDIQKVQAEVMGVFGRWVRAMDDRDMAQFQSTMSGDFYMDYDVTQQYDEDDINRDGRLSAREFTATLDRAFVYWDACETQIVGDILANTYVNVGVYQADAVTGDVVFKAISSLDAVNEEDLVANLAFAINGTSGTTNQECLDSTPEDNLYVTARKVNGSWTIFRASIGIDTTETPGSFHELFKSWLVETYTNTDVETLIPQGGQLSASPNEHVIANFKWTMSGPSSYVLIVMDERNPKNGFALAIPNVQGMLEYIVTTKATLPSAVDVGVLFGLKSSDVFKFEAGGSYKWEVLGLDMQTSAFKNAVKTEVMRSIMATSSVKRFTIAGFYRALDVVVRADTDPSDGDKIKYPLAYSEYLFGYNAYNAYSTIFEITAPNTKSTLGTIHLSGHTDLQKNIDFGCIDFRLSRACNMGVVSSNGKNVLPSMPLLKGWNWIYVTENTGLFKTFRILSDDGIDPLISSPTVEVTDGTLGIMDKDSWDYFTHPQVGATINAVDVSAYINSTTIHKVYLNHWNDDLMAYGNYSAPVSIVADKGVFITPAILTYQGDNWITVEGTDSNGVDHRLMIGVHADEGSTWTPPFSNVQVGESNATAEYFTSSDWEVDTAVDVDNIVTITGQIKTITGTYEISNKGGYKTGNLSIAGGIFSLNVTLYNGWNYVSFKDAEGHWYGANIFTANGLKVLSIDKINNTTYNKSGNFATTQCSAKIKGGAPSGNVTVYWNGYDGNNGYWENRTVSVDGFGNYSIVMPVVGDAVGYSGSYNYFDLYDDKGNYRNVNVKTSGYCTYTPPVMTVSGVYDAGALLPFNGSYYDAGALSTVSVKGTSDQPGRSISVSQWLCGSRELYTATADTTPNGSGTYNWTVSGVNVYGTLNNGYNYLEVTDGYNWNNPAVLSVNAEVPLKPIENVFVTGFTPTYEYCNELDFYNVDLLGATTVTVNGTMATPGASGFLRTSLGEMIPFDSHTTTGDFSAVSDVYNGWNSIRIIDEDWNYYYVYIDALGGDPKPKTIEVVAPFGNTSSIPAAGTYTVTGKNNYMGSFNPDYIRFYFYDYVNYTYNYCSNDANEQANYGYLPITYNSGTGEYSCDVYLTTNLTYVEMYAAENAVDRYHYHGMYWNSGAGYTEWYEKPKLDGNKDSIGEQLRSIERLKRDKVLSDRRESQQ